MLYLLFAISVLSTVTAHLCLKKGVAALGGIKLSVATFSQAIQSGWIWAGGICFVIGFLLWLYILSKMQLNIAYPVIMSIQVVLISVFSWIFLHEYLAWPQIFGIALVVCGIILISFK